jgi:hypothetical protein
MQTQCCYIRGVRCRWHELSRDIYYRPNAKLFLSPFVLPMQPQVATRAGIWSLAKAYGTDAAPNFYVGLLGGLMEAELSRGTTVQDTHQEADGAVCVDAGIDPNFGFGFSQAARNYNQTIRTEPSEGETTANREFFYRPMMVDRTRLMETGDGRAFAQNDRNIRLPPLVAFDEHRTGNEVHSRLDRRWRFLKPGTNNLPSWRLPRRTSADGTGVASGLPSL